MLDCQKSTGAGHASLMMVPTAATKITGTPRYFASKADSGNTTERGFCATCGSTVFGKTSGNAQGMVVFAGSLDDPSQFKPQFSIFAKRGHAWDHMAPAVPRFEGMPPRQGS
ncbi:MAG: aldehyde-activating protein [Alphaproteobacteria bacterium]|nr:aldehyde-activating protein [Alphaproteobacteria bacterium]